MNVENHEPLYSLMVKFSVFIIRLFLECWQLLFNLFVTLFVFVTREIVYQSSSQAWIPEHCESQSIESAGCSGLVPIWWCLLEADSGRTHIAPSLLACSYPSIPSPVSDVYTRYLNSFRRFEYCRIMDQKLISLDSLLILLFPEKPIPEPL